MARSFKEHDGLYAAFDCTDWADFRGAGLGLLRDHAGKVSIAERFLFRGQSCSSWPLIPSFDRHHSTLSAAEKEDRYQRYIGAFKQSYLTYGDIAKSEQYIDVSGVTELELESLAQHHGLYTRLLDWSLSPYIAAFFAVSRVDLCTTGLVSIWALDKEIMRHFLKTELIVQRDLFTRNVRNMWQMGSYTRNYTSTSDLLSMFRSTSTSYPNTLKSGPPALIRFDFPVGQEEEILDDLQMMRINSISIFPGIEGVINWIKKREFG
jgi:hypothetical protein